MGPHQNRGCSFCDFYSGELDIRVVGIYFFGPDPSESRLDAFWVSYDRGLGRLALGESALFPVVDPENLGSGLMDCGRKADLYSVRCLRHSRMAGIRGGRHSAIALGFPGKLIMRLWPATPATARERIAVGAMGKLVHR